MHIVTISEVFRDWTAFVMFLVNCMPVEFTCVVITSDLLTVVVVVVDDDDDVQGTSEILRMFIALTGLQHAGRELKDTVKSVLATFTWFCVDYVCFLHFLEMFA